jgi:hypothetical protein
LAAVVAVVKIPAVALVVAVAVAEFNKVGFLHLLLAQSALVAQHNQATDLALLVQLLQSITME